MYKGRNSRRDNRLFFSYRKYYWRKKVLADTDDGEDNGGEDDEFEDPFESDGEDVPNMAKFHEVS